MQCKRKKERLAVFSQLSLFMIGQKDFLNRKRLTNYLSYSLPISGLSMRLSLRVAQMLLADLETFYKTQSVKVVFYNNNLDQCPP